MIESNKFYLVKNVIDGRTIEVEGFDKKICIIGIPQSGTKGDFFESRKKLLEDLLINKRVQIIVSFEKETVDTIYAQVHLEGLDEPLYVALWFE